MLHCDVDLSSFREHVGRTLDRLQDGIDKSVRAAAYAGEKQALAGDFKNKTGEARRKIRASQVRGGHLTATWAIVAPFAHARFLDEGTKPHEIRPRRANALRWEGPGGDVHFAGKVNHPGTQPTAFMGRAYHKAEAVLYRDLNLSVQALDRIWK